MVLFIRKLKVTHGLYFWLIILLDVQADFRKGIGKAGAETPILWPPDTKSRLIGKDPDARKDCGQEEKETTEDEMVGWHHQLNGHEFE